jgi:hypothetical protein
MWATMQCRSWKMLKSHALLHLVMQQGVLDNTEAPGISSGAVRERGKESAHAMWLFNKPCVNITVPPESLL